MTECELVNGLLASDKEAIQQLVDNYQENVIKTAFYFVANMEDAEDLSQEVFLEIIKSVGRFKRKSSLSTWIYRVTVNKSLDHLRKQKRRAHIHRIESFFMAPNNGPGIYQAEPGGRDTTNDDNERRQILDKAVNSLPENQKIAFILSKYDDLSYKEIADVMNLSLSSVESLIHRAKLKLQNKLVNYFSEYVINTR
jgi:RNA polymerase sigma factor (sigma-70 family)